MGEDKICLKDKLILGMDTSTRACSVSLVKNKEVLGENYTNYKLKHSEKLLLQTKHLFLDTHLNINDVDIFAVGMGPGSFTGLRIGASTAKAFAHIGNKKILGVSSIKATAYALRNESDKICVIFDAQRNDVYCNFYEVNGGILHSDNDDEIWDIDKLLDKLKGMGKVLFAGEGVFKYRDKIKDALKNDALFAGNEKLLPRAENICMSAYEDSKEYSYDNFLPNYIRVSSAEENMKKQV